MCTFMPVHAMIAVLPNVLQTHNILPHYISQQQ